MTPGRTLFVASGNPGKLCDFITAAAALASSGKEAFLIRTLPGLGTIAAPDEVATTFEGNARAKAIYYSLHAPGLLVVADDSGLEVDALDGAPGVYSARYAARAGAWTDDGALTVDQANNCHLLAELARLQPPGAAPVRLGQGQDRGIEQGLDRNLKQGLDRDLNQGLDRGRNQGQNQAKDQHQDQDRRSARYRCVLAAARDGACLCTALGTVEGQILSAPRGQGGFGYDPYFYLPLLAQTMAEVDGTTRLRLSHRGAALTALLRKLEQMA